MTSRSRWGDLGFPATQGRCSRTQLAGSTSGISSKAGTQPSPARLRRHTRGVPSPDGREQPPEPRRCAVGGAGNVYGGPFGGPGGERRSRGGPLPRCPLRNLQDPRPAHPRTLTAWLAASAGSRGPGRYIPRRWRRPVAEGRPIFSALPAPEGPRDRTASPPQPRHLPGATSPPPIQAFLRVPIIWARSRSPRLASDLTNRWLWLSQLGLTLVDCKSLFSRRTLGA